MEFVERSIENATDEEFMSLQQQVQEQIQEQCAKHEHIDLTPAEEVNVGVRVACAEGISDLCQKNAELIALRVEPTKCRAEGLGKEVAEVSKSAQFIVRTMYQNGQLCGEKQKVEAELKSLVNDCVVQAKVTSKERGVYEITYTPKIRGRHSLIVKVNGTQISGSPFQVLAKIHPTHLGEPVRIVDRVLAPQGIALNSKQQLVVTKFVGERGVIVLDKEGKTVQTITCDKFSCLTGVAVDKDNNIYVSNLGTSSLLKFNKEGKLMKTVGQQGTRPGEFNNLGFIKVINDKLYVCDNMNKRVQILNTELEYVNSFGCHGDGDGQHNKPKDIAQDRAGNLHVTDSSNNQVLVFDYRGQFLYSFRKKSAASAQLNNPCGICVGSDQFVYVCDRGNKSVSVFKTSGEFVTSFGHLSTPAGIVIDDDGFVYVSNFDLSGTITTF